MISKAKVRQYLHLALGANVKKGQLVVHNKRSEAVISNPERTLQRLRKVFGKPMVTKNASEFTVRGKGRVILRHVHGMDILQLISN